MSTGNLKAGAAQAAAAIRRLTGEAMAPRRVGVIVGSGLGDVTAAMTLPTVVEYRQIPGFATPSVAGHRGRLLAGDLAGVPAVILEGRYHYYEGYTMRQVTFPARVLAELGVETLVVTNAAGGLSPDFRPGDIMLITDHINLMGDNPLRGPNEDALGPRFPDMNGAYDPGLREAARRVAAAEGVELRHGVYVGVSGPNYETPAELGFFRTIGGDAIGMSTVPEVIAARHAGLRVLGLSCITNRALAPADRAKEGVGVMTVTHEEVLAATASGGAKMARIIAGVIGEMAE